MIERRLEASLQRSRLQKLELFQLHNHIGEGVRGRQSVTPQQVLERNGIDDTFEGLKAQGLIHASGMPDRLFVMTTGTDLGNEVRCAARSTKCSARTTVRRRRRALRFVLGNRDFASRLIGIAEIKQLDEALEAARPRATAGGGHARNCGPMISKPIDGAIDMRYIA